MKEITSVSMKQNITLLTLTSNSYNNTGAYTLLSKISEKNIVVDMISQTPSYGGGMSFSFTLLDNDLKDILSIIGAKNNDLSCEISSGNIKLTFYGKEMENASGVASKVLNMLLSKGIELKIVTTSTVDISVLIDSHNLAEAVKSIKETLNISVI